MELNEQKKQTIAVSIIIPVYNVYEWLDQCMESVVNQTFTEFEALLVDDGSTDGSAEKCDEWARRDSRVRVIHKENEGLSPTRNCGIQESLGTYLAFLDADDWLDITFLEKMYRKAEECDADLVECDIWRYNDNNHTKTYCSCYGSLNRNYSKEEHMIYGNVSIWKLLIRRTLWESNQIWFSDCHSPATPIYALLIAKANKIENVREALYYYRRFRAGSLTMKPKPDKDNKVTGICAFECLLKNFRERELDREYGIYLERIIKYKMTDLLAAFFYRMNPQNYKILADNYYQFIKENFPKEKEIKYLTWGGYNLTRILWHAKYLHDPYGRFNFSSLISIMHPLEEKLSVSHRVRYREMMLEREIQNDFWSILSKVKPDYIIMDFLEERFDIVEYGGGYLTKSDAFDEADIALDRVRVIGRDSELCKQLWEESALEFIRRLENKYPGVQVVLVRNYLAERTGDIQEQVYFDNIDWIRKTNEILERYYMYFQNHCRALKVVEASECEYYFTDKQYEYGAIPSHLNELVNQEIAGMIERSIGI